MMADALVVGAGVIGASIAWHFAQSGNATVLVDRQRPASAPGATWASAGGLRQQGRHPAEAPLSRAAAARWLTVSGELDADLEVRIGGHLHLAEDADGAAVVDRRVADDRAAGVTIERLDADAIRALAPALTTRAVAGAFTPGDGQAHPGRTARAFAAAAERLGCRTLFGTGVTLGRGADGRVVATIGGEAVVAGTVVVAAGAWTADLLAGIGVTLPVRWRGLQMLLSEATTPVLAPTVTAVGRNLSLKQLPSGQLMVGGAWHGAPVASRIDARPVAAHVSRQWSTAVAILPAMAALKPAQYWVGVEAQSIDGLPFIGPVAELPGLYVAAGFSNHGFQISPAVGALVARDIAEGGEPLLAPFHPGRARRVDADRLAAFRAESADA